MLTRYGPSRAHHASGRRLPAQPASLTVQPAQLWGRSAPPGGAEPPNGRAEAAPFPPNGRARAAPPPQPSPRVPLPWLRMEPPSCASRPGRRRQPAAGSASECGQGGEGLRERGLAWGGVSRLHGGRKRQHRLTRPRAAPRAPLRLQHVVRLCLRSLHKAHEVLLKLEMHRTYGAPGPAPSAFATAGLVRKADVWKWSWLSSEQEEFLFPSPRVREDGGKEVLRSEVALPKPPQVFLRIVLIIQHRLRAASPENASARSEKSRAQFALTILPLPIGSIQPCAHKTLIMLTLWLILSNAFLGRIR